MAGLLSIFAEFEHEILRERIAEGYGAAMRQAPITPTESIGFVGVSARIR